MQEWRLETVVVSQKAAVGRARWTAELGEAHPQDPPHSSDPPGPQDLPDPPDPS